jgi:hypothetical protein
MMNSVYFAYVVVTFAYFPVATAGYAAYGNEVNADVLLSVSQPPVLIAVANFMVLVHIAASYQVSVWREPDWSMPSTSSCDEQVPALQPQLVLLTIV